MDIHRQKSESWLEFHILYKNQLKIDQDFNLKCKTIQFLGKEREGGAGGGGGNVSSGPEAGPEFYIWLN